MIPIVTTKTGDFALTMGIQYWISEITLDLMEKDVQKLNLVILVYIKFAMGEKSAILSDRVSIINDPFYHL